MILVHILRDGVILVPPFPAPKIPRLLHSGSVLANDFFWHEGMSEWEPVGSRWEPDAGSAPQTSAAIPPMQVPSATAPTQAAPIRPRYHRTSLLHQAKKRYYETIVPWATAPAADRVAS